MESLKRKAKNLVFEVESGFNHEHNVMLISELAGIVERMRALEPTHPSIIHFQGILSTLQQQYPSHKSTGRNFLSTSSPSSSSSYPPQPQDAEHAEASSLLSHERIRIDTAYGAADDVLSQAREARAELFQQKQMLASPSLSGTLAKLPMIHNLMIRINQRKNRNVVIMAGFIAVLVLILLFYIFG